MRTYEFALILRKGFVETKASYKKFVQDLLKKVNGKIINDKILGVRTLAYAIQHETEGNYGIFNIELPEDKISELDKEIKLKENILRYLIIKEE